MVIAKHQSTRGMAGFTFLKDHSGYCVKKGGKEQGDYLGGT